jgi:protein-tyrosine phosphatase
LEKSLKKNHPSQENISLMCLLFRPHFNIPPSALLSADFIEPRFFVGGVDAAKEAFFLEEKVTCVINCAVELGELEYPAHVTVLKCPAHDHETENILAKFLPEVLSFVNKHSKEKVLFHCRSGQSRSATLLIAVLVCSGLTLLEAFSRVKTRREIVYPNIGFFRQLVGLEKQIHNGESSIPLDVVETLHAHFL